MIRIISIVGLLLVASAPLKSSSLPLFQSGAASPQFSREGASPFDRDSQSRRIDFSNQLSEVRFKFSPDARVINLLQGSPSRRLSLSVRAASPGQRFNFCLEGTQPEGGACFNWIAPDSKWHELNLTLSEAHDTDALKLRNGSEKGSIVSATGFSVSSVSQKSTLWLADLRLDPPSTSHSLETVANAMQVSLSTAAAARALNLDEHLSWIIMRLTLHCSCSPADIMQKRKHMSWGEICQSVGWNWSAAIQDVQSHANAAGLKADAATGDQLMRSASNSPDDLVEPQDIAR
jgi:hypothetical protein